MSATRIDQENGTRAGRNALPLAHLGYLDCQRRSVSAFSRPGRALRKAIDPHISQVRDSA